MSLKYKKKRKINLEKTLIKLLSLDLLNIKTQKKTVYTLDFFEFLKSLREISFLLTNLKRSIKNLYIGILVSNSFNKTILERFLEKSKYKNYCRIYHNSNDIKNEKVIFIFSSLGDTNFEHVIKRLFLNEKYLFFVSNYMENLKKDKGGSYSVYMENDKLKKLFFFVTFLNKILSKINENNQ